MTNLLEYACGKFNALHFEESVKKQVEADQHDLIDSNSG